MLPGITDSPAAFLRPLYFGLESLPFLLPPPDFLVAQRIPKILMCEGVEEGVAMVEMVEMVVLFVITLQLPTLPFILPILPTLAALLQLNDDNNNDCIFFFVSVHTVLW